MPSPFPGMDPYLEAKNRWRSFYQYFNVVMCGALNARLSTRFAATIGVRLYLAEPERDIDLEVDARVRRPPELRGGENMDGMVANPHLLLELEQVRESFVQIIIPGEDDRVVTVIETLSPANKAVGSEGRELYRKKQREVLDGPSHLIEIDLLRSGEYTVAAPRRELARKAKQYDYLVSLSRAGHRGTFETWPFTIRERFPRVLVPLAGDDPDVVLKLQAVFDRCYDEGAFARWIDYRKVLDPALTSAEDADWAVSVLREKNPSPRIGPLERSSF